MPEIETIKLKKPLESPHGKVFQIVLREPTYTEYLEHGDPYTIASTEGGALFSVENPEVIKRYINLCLLEPKDPATLLQAGAAVAREVKNRMLGFFQSAEEEEDKKLSAKSETTSPSADTAPTASTTSAS